jgi:hypothetical protein
MAHSQPETGRRRGIVIGKSVLRQHQLHGKAKECYPSHVEKSIASEWHLGKYLIVAVDKWPDIKRHGEVPPVAKK